MNERIAYVDTGGTDREVVELFVWLAGPPQDEGVVSFNDLPLVMAKRELAERFVTYIEGLVAATGKEARLVVYRSRETLLEFGANSATEASS